MAGNLNKSDEILKRNPKLAEITKLLEDKRKERRDALERRLDEANGKLSSTKSEWLKQQTLYLSVQHVLGHNEDCDLGVALNAFQIAECLNSVDKDSAFNVGHHDLISMLDDKKLDQGKKLLSQKVETHLSEACLNLMKFHDLPKLPENHKVLHARALQLGEMVKNEKLEFAKLDKHSSELGEKLLDLYMDYHQELHNCVDSLTKILSKYTFDLQPKKNQIVIKDAIQSCETLAAKLKCTRVKLVCETYSPQRIEALKKIRLHQEETSTLLHTELERTNLRLEAYKNMGGEFEAIARKYSEVRSEIDKNQSTMEQIKKSIK
ncbi:HAUS augmin-like complex subunit 4 isoform X2 [Ciona intestinalis]